MQADLTHAPSSTAERGPIVELSPAKATSVVLAALIPALTGAAYLTGVAYHQAYLATFDVPYGIFTKSTTDYFLCAHKAIVAVLVALCSTTKGFVILAMLFLALFFWAIVNRLDKRLGGNPKMTIVRERLNRSGQARLFGEVFGIPALLSLFSAYVVFILAFVLVLPGVIGTKAGRLDAQVVRAAINGGCQDPRASKRIHCTDVIHDGHQLARGFILEASEKHVFLIENGITKVIPIGDNAFVTVESPTIGSAH